MRKKLFLFVVSMLVVAPFGVRAEDLQLTAGQPLSVSLTGPSVTYTLTSSTGIDSLSASGSTLTLTLTAGDSVVVNQANGYEITNNLSQTTNCVTDLTTTITFTQTVVITAGTTSRGCAVGGGGGSQPSSVSISINNGAAETSSRDVTLQLSANDAAEMIISNDLSFSDATWQPYATSKSWTLTEGLGAKRVYVNYKTQTGGTSQPISAVITLVAASSSGSSGSPSAPSAPGAPSAPTVPQGSALVDGWLVKEIGSPAIYFVEGGVLKPILNEAVFLGRGFSWSDIRTIASKSGYVVGATLTLPVREGSIIKKANDQRVYVITNGKRRWIKNEEAFNGLGYSWYMVTVVSDEAFDAYLETTPFLVVGDRHPDGTLIKYAGDSKVYLVDGGKKRWIKTEEEFRARGYLFVDVITILSTETFENGVDIGTTVQGYSTDTQTTGSFTRYLTVESIGDEVRLLQATLKQLGFFPAKANVTGYFGSVTRNAVIDYQKAHGIDPLGVVGPETRNSLNEDL